MKRPRSPRYSERLDYEGDEAAASSRPSSSSSPVRKDGFEYDVFLSFRGPDTRNGFTSHLHAFLKLKGITAFIDSENLEKGEMVEELFKCIQKSKIFVPIFSKGYADSRWCLKEIAKIVECKRLILPVFFDVEPRDVRDQTTGLFEPAFTRYRENSSMDKVEVSKWSGALTEAGRVSGYTLADTEGNEAKIIALIVKRILNEVSKTSLHVARYPVGLDSRIAHVEEMLDVEDNNVRMVVIHGMGGIGKTTLAKAVYNQIYTRFNASSFIPNVREAAKQSTGLESLQEKLLRDFFSDENVKISSVDKGIEIIRNRIRSKKVLLVLDDVDKKSQVDALAGSIDWFCSGSRIIITTRDKRALGAKSVKLYEPKVLDTTQSLELFSWHAFGKKDPAPKFAELSEEVASAGGGLPLALTIFGSHFFDMETVEEWKEGLQKLQEDQNEDIHVSLKISFDALDEKEKKVFLDIACFFLQENKIEFALLMWEDCKFFPKTTIQVLRHKSLININDATGKFEMHDLIRDMGRKIAQDNRSRLWKDDETLDVLETKKGMEKIEAIQLYSGTYWAPTYVEAEPFVAMSELRMLRLGKNVELKGEFEHFPTKLRWLQWCIEEDLDSLPGGLHLENIVVLDLSCSRITQLWNPQGLESTKVFGKMKVLNLACCWNLTNCLDFERMPHLKKLDLSYCVPMSELDPSIGHLKSLTHFSLLGCGSLKTLPPEIWQLTSLEELDLSSCTEITALPSQMEDPKSLKPVLLGKLRVLNFKSCHNLTICPDFTSMPYIEKFDFSSCEKMSELHPSIGLLERLTHLPLRKCGSLKAVPQEIWQLTSLEELDLSSCTEITTLPSQMEDPKSLEPVLLGKLKVVNFGDCSNLTGCPDFTSMPHLEILDFRSCTKMSELDPSIGLLESLTHLNLSGCESLKTLPREIWQLTSLIRLDLSHCTEITTLPSQMEDPKSLKPVLLGKLRVLYFINCSNLTSCPDFTSMPHLETLDFTNCTKMSELDPSIGLLESLTHLSLKKCGSLKAVPQEIWQLTSLEELDLSFCIEITTLPSQMEDPKSLEPVLLGKLEVLEFEGCSNLTICPDFTSMPHLETLDFTNCTKMSELDPSIGLLESLAHLNLRECWSLKTLPQEIWQLTSLEELDLTGCYQISALPESMRHLKQLKWLYLQRCSSLTEILECICSFLNLEELDLSWTTIEELPHSIVSLEKLEVLSVSHCHGLKLLPWFLPSLTELEARGCGKLEDVPGINQMILLRRLHLGGCRSLHDSFFERLQEAHFENLEEFSISGRRVIDGGSSYPQSISFLLPKQFDRGIVYLHVEKSSLDNICSEVDEWEDESPKGEEDRNMDSNDSELAYKSIPSDEVKDSRPGRVVLIEMTTGDAKFQFSALLRIKTHRSSYGYDEPDKYRKLPTATFGGDSELMKMAKQGEFKGNGDARLRTMMTMRVSIDGCVLLHGDLFTYMNNYSRPDPIAADDNFVVEFDW
ncbi:disease resistance protein RPV1-like [Nymphaea colorata]|nr:disease resistance protein RPV1-like [Nymphaea colorata]